MPVGRAQEAVDHAGRARELDPESPTWVATLGAMYYWAGDYHRAIEHLSKAIAMEPRSAQAYVGGLLKKELQGLQSQLG